MGNAQVSQLQDLNKSINQICTNIVNNTKNVSQSNCTATNNISINVGGNLKCGAIVDQTASTICQLSANMTNLNENTVANQLATQLQALLQSGQGSSQAFLATAISAQISEQQLIQEVNNTISTNINNDIFNTCATSSASINGTTLTIGKDWECPTSSPNITINQNAIAQATANCLADNTVKALLNNSTISSIVSQMIADQQSKQSGLASLTGMLALVIIGVIVLAIAGVFLLPKLLGGSSGSGIVGVSSPSAFSTNKYLKPALIIGGVVLLIIIIIVIVVIAKRNSNPPPTNPSTK